MMRIRRMIFSGSGCTSTGQENQEENHQGGDDKQDVFCIQIHFLPFDAMAALNRQRPEVLRTASAFFANISSFSRFLIGKRHVTPGSKQGGQVDPSRAFLQLFGQIHNHDFIEIPHVV